MTEISRRRGRYAEEQWRVVDEGWGRRAVEFATLAEPTNVREYVAVHHRLGVGAGDRLLDVACGSGLAVELAGLRGARLCRHRCVAAPRRRRPGPQPRGRPAGRGHERAARGRTAPSRSSPASAASGARPRALWPRCTGSWSRAAGWGSRVWGHIKASPGAWAFAPFTLASRGEGREPGEHGRPGPAGCGRGAAGGDRLHRRRAGRPAVRLRVRRPGGLRAGPGLDRTGLRGDRDGRRGGLRGVGGGAGTGTGPGGPAAPRPHPARGLLRSQAQAGTIGHRRGLARRPRRRRRAALRRLPRHTSAHAGGAAALRRRPARRRLRDERVASVGVPAGGAGRAVRAHG